MCVRGFQKPYHITCTSPLSMTSSCARRKHIPRQLGTQGGLAESAGVTCKSFLSFVLCSQCRISVRTTSSGVIFVSAKHVTVTAFRN